MPPSIPYNRKRKTKVVRILAFAPRFYYHKSSPIPSSVRSMFEKTSFMMILLLLNFVLVEQTIFASLKVLLTKRQYSLSVSISGVLFLVFTQHENGLLEMERGYLFWSDSIQNLMSTTLGCGLLDTKSRKGRPH